MPKTILRLKISNSRSLLLYTIITLLILTSAAFGGENQFLFHLEDLKDPGSLAVKLQDARAVLSQHIAAQLSAETQQLLDEYDGISNPSAELQKALLDDLNRLLQAGPLYDADNFTDIELSEPTEELLTQNPKSGETLVRLNRALLADAYPYELTSLTEERTPEDSKGIEKCRENLRQVQLAREKYSDDTNKDPQWLSELAPEYLEKKTLLCPADATNGKPGVLTEGAADPALPCSYLYEFRPSQKSIRETILANEGDMFPIVRCEHHLLNLSAGGKLYRNGPQRAIYKGKMKVQVARVNASGDLYTQLKAQLGEDFLKSPEGQDLLKQIHTSVPPSTPSIIQQQTSLIGKPIPNIALTDLSGKPVKLETIQSRAILLNIFSIDAGTSGPNLQRLEKLLKNYDVSQLQVIGISTDDSAKAIETFKEKYGLSMPIWIGKNTQIQASGLITLLLNPELIVQDTFIASEPEVISQKVKQAIEFEK